jgi:hypothetical protein
LKRRENFEDLGVNAGINTGIYLNEIGWEGVDWINLAEKRDQWRALVNTVIKLQSP